MIQKLSKFISKLNKLKYSYLWRSAHILSKSPLTLFGNIARRWLPLRKSVLRKMWRKPHRQPKMSHLHFWNTCRGISKHFLWSKILWLKKVETPTRADRITYHTNEKVEFSLPLTSRMLSKIMLQNKNQTDPIQQLQILVSASLH